MDKNKRFWCLNGYEGETSVIVDGKFAPTNEWLCGKLDELAEENQQLKNDCGILIQSNQEIRKENEQLKDENKELKNDKEQLSIDFLGYKMKLRKVLRNHYLECQKWGDTHTQLIIKQIASDLGLI